MEKISIEFRNGEAKAPLKISGKSKQTGTQITFYHQIVFINQI